MHQQETDARRAVPLLTQACRYGPLSSPKAFDMWAPVFRDGGLKDWDSRGRAHTECIYTYICIHTLIHHIPQSRSFFGEGIGPYTPRARIFRSARKVPSNSGA